jgi:hypothetical protein
VTCSPRPRDYLTRPHPHPLQSRAPRTHASFTKNDKTGSVGFGPFCHRSNMAAAAKNQKQMTSNLARTMSVSVFFTSLLECYAHMRSRWSDSLPKFDTFSLGVAPIGLLPQTPVRTQGYAFCVHSVWVSACSYSIIKQSCATPNGVVDIWAVFLHYDDNGTPHSLFSLHLT